MRTVEAVVADMVENAREFGRIASERERAERLIDTGIKRSKEAAAKQGQLREELETIIRYRATHAEVPA